MSWIWGLSAYLAGLAIFFAGCLLGAWLARGKNLDLDAAYQRLSREVWRYLDFEKQLAEDPNQYAGNAEAMRQEYQAELRRRVVQCDAAAGLGDDTEEPVTAPHA